MKAILYSIIITILVIFPTIAGCNNAQTQPSQVTQSKPHQQIQFKRTISPAPYDGNRPAIIFRMDDVAEGQNEKAVEEIIRLFGKNNVPLDVGVIPHADGHDSYDMPFLRNYLDAGIIDISIHGNQHLYMEFDTKKAGTNYDKLKSDLITARRQFQEYYGIAPVAITVPYDYFDEEGYKTAQDAGFKIFSTQKAVDPHPSAQPVDWAGNWSETGMYRLCTVSDVAHWDAEGERWGDLFLAESGNELFHSINWGLNNLGVAVVGIHPQAFVDNSNNIDIENLATLEDIIKLCKQQADITTFEAWYKYTSAAQIKTPHVRQNKTPPYTGGPAIIFRLDDVEKGVHEDAVKAIIEVFRQNNVPIDIGVIPFVSSRNSYEMPFLLEYLNAGVIDISVHGYRHTFREFDTDLSGMTYEEMDWELKNCFKDAYGGTSYTPYQTTYEELKLGLIKAREQFKYYFGITPIAFTAPYDNFNKDGYRAAQDAGFDVFSSMVWIDPQVEYLSRPWPIERVDYFGHRDPTGMYRLPVVSYLAVWYGDTCGFGGLLPLDSFDDELHLSIVEGLESVMRIAVINAHPQEFLDASGKVDPGKLKQLDNIIKFILDNKWYYGQIITFTSWCQWREG